LIAACIERINMQQSLSLARSPQRKAFEAAEQFTSYLTIFAHQRLFAFISGRLSLNS